MGDMETGMVLGGEFHSQTGALITCLLAADFRMMAHLGIVAVLLLGLCHIAVDDIRILAMGHDGQWGRREDSLQGFPAVDEHIARRRTHEQFDAWNTVDVEL